MVAAIVRRFRLLTPAQRGRWLALAPLGLAVTLLEAFGGLVVFALLARMLGSGAAPAGAVESLLSALPAPSAWSPPVALAAWAAGIYIVRNGLLAMLAWWRARLVASDAATLATRLFGMYVDAPWSFHLHRHTGALMETLRGSTRAFFMAFESSAIVLVEIGVVIGLAAVAVTVAPVSVTVATAGGSLLLAAMIRAMRTAQARGGARTMVLGARLYQHVQHGLGAVKELSVLGRTHHFVDAFARDAAAAAGLEGRRALLDAVPRLVLESAFVLGMLGFVLAGAAAGSAAAYVPLASLYAYAGFRVLPAATRIALHMNMLRWCVAETDGLVADLGSLAGRAATHAADPPLRMREALRAEGVSFAYEPGGPAVLADVSLTIAPGESIAIVGATGAGKTTLVDLLLGLLTPSAGDITVDGVPIQQRLGAWQRSIGYVPQTPYFLDDTLRRNIALGQTDDEIDQEALTRAVGLAHLERVVASLPRGLDTGIGENGVRLSGGERQRVAIARALYANPALLVFDEATSAVDAGTARAIAEAIETLRGGRTVVVIAHRLDTVRRCDRIVLLAGGRVEAVGTYAELAASAGFRTVAAI
jgi:ABC-type multidrug transport system fused ATPase/permease subunit